MGDMKVLGRWALEEFDGVYCWNLKPSKALVASAGFDAARPELYTVPRREVEPPAVLLDLVRSPRATLNTRKRFPLTRVCAQVMPWVDAALATAVARNADASLPDSAKDKGAINFLKLLMWTKTVRSEPTRVHLRMRSCCAAPRAPGVSARRRGAV